jgi:FtsH-binding integral membrane protein
MTTFAAMLALLHPKKETETLMRKTILRYGLISGLLCAALIAVATPLEERVGFNYGYFIGYTVIVLSFLLVFFGIRSYRDQEAGGQITFMQAFAVGISITLITCVFYVVTWEIIYFNFTPDFMDKYAAFLVQKAHASGMSGAALQAQLVQIQKMKRLYNNVFYNAAFTLLEPFPVGLAITLISAAVLRKRAQPQPASAPLLASL